MTICTNEVAAPHSIEASTKISTEHWGLFRLGASGTVFTKYELALTPASPLSDQLILGSTRADALTGGAGNDVIRGGTG